MTGFGPAFTFVLTFLAFCVASEVHGVGARFHVRLDLHRVLPSVAPPTRRVPWALRRPDRSGVAVSRSGERPLTIHRSRRRRLAQGRSRRTFSHSARSVAVRSGVRV